jgi:dolichol-phosphate mannosyltransferase
MSVPRLSVIVPTFNERDNVEALVRALEAALPNEAWEVIFVDDDSPDGTAEFVRSVGRDKPNVRCVQRLGRRGLSSAVIEGFLASSSPYLAVIDGDLQHDERLLPAMLETLEKDGADVVVGSRYVAGAGVGSWNQTRVAMSRFATWCSRLVLQAALNDPMSGFFVIRRSAFESVMRKLSGTGYKILLDVLSSGSGHLRWRELPYEFRERNAGVSKVDSVVLWEYLLLLLDKLLGRRLPPRFTSFALVGGMGVLVHFAILAACMAGGVRFAVAQGIATFVAMTSNFLLNNVLTYSDRRLHGVRLITGLLSFYLVCATGAIANVGVASFVFERDPSWWLAGLAGVLVGTVWNYVMTALFTWGAGRPGR